MHRITHQLRISLTISYPFTRNCQEKWYRPYAVGPYRAENSVTLSSADSLQLHFLHSNKNHCRQNMPKMRLCSQRSPDSLAGVRALLGGERGHGRSEEWTGDGRGIHSVGGKKREREVKKSGKEETKGMEVRYSTHIFLKN